MGWFDSQRPPQQAGGIGGAIGQAFQQQQPGSLASLGGGLNGPQPVPGMPPQGMPTNGGGMNDGGRAPTPYPFPDPFGSTRNPTGQRDFPYRPIPGTDWGGHPIPTNPDGTIQLGGTRGSGQPLNQPMGPPGSQAGPLPSDAGPMPQFGPYGGGYDQRTHQWVSNTSPVGIAPQPTGSLQSLGGGLGQMINLRGPDGSTKSVPADQAQHWIGRGAVRV